ncbi:uncharacterized protein DEA37_0009243 [Paragonimus westermani]|uniref:Uncharacterized protein n=1 Tax=Paragonimus westermani TaxID=34504 RepID=A0A5J4P109_9TREM|nr:uncharacterized protein DEA37_0009243 [Paragonimus westermani]
MNPRSLHHPFGRHFIQLFTIFAMIILCHLSTTSAYRTIAPEIVDEEGAYQIMPPYWIRKRNFLVDSRLGKRFEHRVEPELEKRSYLVDSRLG